MKPGQIYLSEERYPRHPTPQWSWQIILITKIGSLQAAYRMISYDIIAQSENFYRDPEQNKAFATSSLFACELKRLSRKDLPLYMDGKVTRKFEQLIKGGK